MTERPRTPHPRPFARPATVGSVLVLALAVAGCSDPEPTLLDEADFDGVLHVDHESGQMPYWIFCSGLAGFTGERVANTYLEFGSANDTIITALVDGSSADVSADENLEHAELVAHMCTEDVKDAVLGPLSIEPLTGLDDDSIGWRAESGDDVVGEYVAIKLDEWRILAVSYQTEGATPEVDMDELVRMAREGAAQFEPKDE